MAEARRRAKPRNFWRGQRSLLTLAAAGQMTAAELARRTGVSREAARQQVSRYIRESAATVKGFKG